MKKSPSIFPQAIDERRFKGKEIFDSKFEIGEMWVGGACLDSKGYLLNDSCSLYCYCPSVLAMPKAFGTKTNHQNDGSRAVLNGYFSLEEILF